MRAADARHMARRAPRQARRGVGAIAGGRRPVLVIAGAGYAGLTAYLELRRRPRRPALRVVLVDRAPSHYFTTELHEFAVGEEDERDITVPLARVVEPPDQLFVASVERVDWEKRRLLCDDGELAYDRLILALGSVPEYFGVPGAKQHGLVLQDLRGAARLRRRLESLAADDPRARVAIVGGGLTGVQLAAEVAEAYPDFRIVLIDASRHIMPGFEPELVSAAERVLREKGVELACGRPVTQVAAGRVTLAGGEERACELVVWAGGVRASPVAERSGLPVGRDGRLVVDEYLRVNGPGAAADVFAAGDCAAPRDPETGEPVPPTAQLAVQAGRLAGRNAWATFAGGELRPFEPRVRGVFASLGRREGVGHWGRESLYGVPALVVKRLVEAQHAYDVGGVAYLLRRLATLAGMARPARRRDARIRRKLEPLPRPPPGGAPEAQACRGQPGRGRPAGRAPARPGAKPEGSRRGGRRARGDPAQAPARGGRRGSPAGGRRGPGGRPARPPSRGGGRSRRPSCAARRSRTRRRRRRRARALPPRRARPARSRVRGRRRRSGVRGSP